MKAVVVYESLWGNTAAIAHAIAEGLGPETQVMSTAEASGAALASLASLADTDLLVAGSPLLAFSLPSDKTLQNIGAGRDRERVAPDLSQPSMRSWLNTLPAGRGRSAAFETRIWWSPGSAAGAISRELEQLGYLPVAKPQRFIVKGKYGPLREGELERAKQWGAELARAMEE
jgi:hypothetical protein